MSAQTSQGVSEGDRSSLIGGTDKFGEGQAWHADAAAIRTPGPVVARWSPGGRPVVAPWFGGEVERRTWRRAGVLRTPGPPV
ncbi:hypothetical protein ACWCOV_36745 [Kribbella sp. NPDC002412]